MINNKQIVTGISPNDEHVNGSREYSENAARGQRTKHVPRKLVTSRRNPWLLRISSNTLQTIAGVIGVTTGTAVSVALFAKAPAESILGRLFDLSNPQGLIPLVMLGMFFWGVFLILLRRLRVRRMESLSNPDVMSALTETITTIPLDELLTKLDGSHVSKSSPLVRRLCIVIRQWIAKPSLQDAISLLNQQAVSDTEDIHHAFGTAKTFIWALPVLGLIGTVVGIASAVGDFGQLIGGNVDDVVVIKQSLVQVTSGLSFAFTTTLLGLLAALLIVMPSSAQQAREEKLVTRTESIVTEHFLPQLQRHYPEQDYKGGVAGIDHLRETLIEIARSTVEAAGMSARRVMEESQRSLAEWHKRISTDNQRAAAAISSAAGKIGVDLAKASDEFLSRLSLVQESMDHQMKILLEALDRGVASSAESTQRLGGALEKHDRTVLDVVTQLQAIQAASESLVVSQAALSASMQELTNGDSTRTIESLSSTLAAIGRQAERTNQTLNSLVGATEVLTGCHTALQTGLERFDSMGLPTALNGLGQTLAEVSEVLGHFQEPIVFQAVRASTVVRSDAVTSHANAAERA